MKLTGNTILITGGASGIGRGLAEALSNLDNKVIISGRRIEELKKVKLSNPRIEYVQLDVTNSESIIAAAEKLVIDYPELNVLINNAGVMELDDVSTPINDKMLLSGIETNFMGPIRMTSALVEHLKSQPSSTIINVTSGMGFVPFGIASVYSATKAALHSYSLTLRYQLRHTSVSVVELVPPWVRTTLLNSQDAPKAMPFNDFISEVLSILATDAEEVLVERVKPLRFNPGKDENILVTSYNNDMLAGN